MRFGDPELTFDTACGLCRASNPQPFGQSPALWICSRSRRGGACQPTMETKLERIAAKAVKQRPGRRGRTGLGSRQFCGSALCAEANWRTDEPQPDGLGEILHTRCWRCRRIEPRKNPPVNPVPAARAMFGPESAPTARDGGRIALWRRLSCSKSP